MQQIISKLEQLRDLKDALSLLEMEKGEALSQAIPPEVRAAMNDIEDEFGEKRDALFDTIAVLDAQVKEAVLAAGSSVKADGIMAVYSKPRISWDSKALNGYAAAHPEITAFCKEGKPSVSIRGL